MILDIRHKTGIRPGRILFGLPLPRKWVAWGLRTFGHPMPDVAAAVEVLESGLSAEKPLTLHASDEEDAEIYVYLG